MTITEIAEALAVPRSRVEYVLDTRHWIPVAETGFRGKRYYDGTVIDAVCGQLDEIEAWKRRQGRV